MQFPAYAWIKENGYLGLLGYDAVSGELVYASKSTTEGEYAAWFKDLCLRSFPDKLDDLKAYLADTNTCLLFEVILPKLDPHIINYTADHLVLLDIVKRQAEFETLPAKDREALAENLSIKPKQLAATFKDWPAFENWVTGLKGLEFTVDGMFIEGFVIEDSSRYHVKVKLDYYSFWKQMRSALDAIKSGKQPKIKQEYEYPEQADEVIAFMQSLPAAELANASITDIRRQFSAVQITK